VRKVRELAEIYQKLNNEERHSFAELVAPVDTSEMSGERIAEICNRADDIDSGRVELIDGEEFLRRFKAI
jgi:hypothetical protein